MFVPAPGGGGSSPSGLSGLQWAWATMQVEVKTNTPKRLANLQLLLQLINQIK